MTFLRARRPLLLALALGLVAPDGFEPLALWPLMLLCLAGLVELIARTSRAKRAFALGWWFGMGLFCVGLNWIATAFTFQAAMPAWLGWIAVVLLSLYLSVFAGIATLAGWWLWRQAGGGSRLALSLMFAGTWIVSEYLRATVFTGFAWNPVAAIWAPVPLVPQATLPWIGTYGLSGLTVLAAGLLGAGVAWLRNRRPIGQHRVTILAAIAAPLIVSASIAAAHLLTSAGPDGVRLRIVQPNIPQDDKWKEGASERNFAKISRLTGMPGREPRLILWPEVAVPWWIEEDGEARRAIAELIGPQDVLLLGAVSVRRDAGGDPVAASNSLFVMDPMGRLLDRYDKSHLVPYGEYLPMRPILSAIGVSRLAPGGIDFDAGPGPRDVDVSGIGPVGVQICYEVTFAGHVVDRRHRPRFLFNPSNDAWFGSWGPPQHLAQARLRAIEEGLPVIRATPTGISAIIDADGRLRAFLPWRHAGAIDGRLPATRPPTVFARHGNVLALGLAVLLCALGFASPRRRV